MNDFAAMLLGGGPEPEPADDASSNASDVSSDDSVRLPSCRACALHDC